MAENMIKFLRGNVASLPQTATAGAVYFTKDEGLYLGLEDGSYHRYGDFITVANVAALPSTGAHETCMYYCEAENILAKWDGAEWVQINKQKTLEQLGGVAKSVYEAKMALLEKADTDNATAISDLTTYVGAIPETATATNIVAYVQEKTAGIATDTALEELTGRVATAEGDIDKLEAALGAEGATGKAVAAAQDAADKAQAAADKAQGEVDTLEGKVGAVEDGKTVVGLIETAQAQADKGVQDAATAQAAADKAQGEVDALELVVGTPAEGKTIVQMIEDAQAAATYDDTQVKADIKANADAIDAIEEDYLKAADKTELVKAIDAEKQRAEGIEGGLETRLKAVEDDYLKAADKEELQDNIDAVNEALELLTEGVDADKVDGVKDLIKYVEDHGPVVTGMQEGIADNAGAIADLAEVVGKEAEGEAPATGLVKDIADNAAAIATEKARAEGKEAELAQADIDNLAAAKKYTDDEIAELKIGDYAKQSDLDAHTGDAVAHITAAERTAWNAAEKNAKDHADGLNTAMNARVEALEAIDHDHENKGVLDGITAEKVAAWDGAKAGAEATAAAALSAAKSELEGKITAEAEAARAAEKANADAITIINGSGEGSIAKALADAKAYADTAESDAVTAANAYTDAALTWGSF